ncbi:MAG: arginyltransferase [Acetobacter syzygii]|uniref:arginyltransferase n=1 Tax=Acetobacter syzygii TaxID=146476 RepID=UPI0039ED5B45
MTSPLRNPQFFYTTTPQPCPYLPARMERKILADLSVPDADTLHSRLSCAGFRRSHTLAYAPLCEGCSACIPIRLPVADFTPSRTQKRIGNRNADLTATLLPPTATSEQYTLFHRYLSTRHADGEMAGMSPRDYRIMVEETTVDTQIIEFRTPDQKLVAVSLTDTLDDGLSAVYSFYDPSQPMRSLGVYVILFLIRQTFLLGRPYLYLGYWIPGSPKMAYKSGFRPAEILRQDVWRTLDPTQPVNTERCGLFPDAPLF